MSIEKYRPKSNIEHWNIIFNFKLLRISYCISDDIIYILEYFLQNSNEQEKFYLHISRLVVNLLHLSGNQDGRTVSSHFSHLFVYEINLIYWTHMWVITYVALCKLIDKYILIRLKKAFIVAFYAKFFFSQQRWANHLKIRTLKSPAIALRSLTHFKRIVTLKPAITAAADALALLWEDFSTDNAAL